MTKNEGETMSDNKTMIYFYSVLFLVFALLAYAADLNSQFHFVQLNSAFASNSFCFSILSGILTGVVVALAAEVRQYLLHKRQMRSVVYSITSDLYSVIAAHSGRIVYYINNHGESVPEDFGGDMVRELMLARIEQLQMIDYVPFSKKDKVRIALKEFAEKSSVMKDGARNLIDFKIKHVQTQMEFLRRGIHRKMIPSSFGEILKVLKEANESLKKCLVVLDELCGIFEKIDDKHYHWGERKKEMKDYRKRIEKDIFFSS